MKINHNKKRNTLFLYESLVREYTKAKLDNDPRKLQEISNLPERIANANEVF